MAEENFTVVTEFILLGLTDRAELKVVLFVLFLVVYAVTLVGNLGMVFLIQISPRLHTPMYFFLSCLSFVDACYSSAIAPKMLTNLLVVKGTLSFSACMVQHLCFGIFVTTEGFVLSVMAYDRYVAIYKPLLYSVRMAPRVYVPLITASYVGGIVNASVHSVATFSLSFCESNQIRHAFCDIPPLLALSCSDTRTNQLLLFSFVGSVEVVTILIILISYGFILLAILRVHSAEGRRKAFSTCDYHLTAVSIYHGTILFMYVRPSSSYALDHDMIVSVFYSIVIPMLNPIIYSLRNKDVKEAMKRVFGKLWFINKVYFSN
ncbi:olfactory receptor 5J2-like [Vicugna pacos]|uniref:Olfactory receptor n=1 Tax=Vicugna pacos TaxID=30538 RepID=A0ABM5E0Z6_VICPA